MAMRMVRMFTLALTLLLGSCSFLVTNSQQESSPEPGAEIVENKQNGKVFYHLRYQLTQANIVALDSIEYEQFRIDGGQFEVKLNKALFPIPADNCQSDIILRMPWTDTDLDDAEDKILQKWQLYQNIVAVRSGQLNSVAVIIELNPYVTEQSGNVLLDYCNVFFRSRQGSYIDTL